MVDYIIRPAIVADYIGILVVNYNVLQSNNESDAILDRIVELQVSYNLTTDERKLIDKTHIIVGSNHDVLGYITTDMYPEYNLVRELKIIPPRRGCGLELKLIETIDDKTRHIILGRFNRKNQIYYDLGFVDVEEFLVRSSKDLLSENNLDRSMIFSQIKSL